MCLSVWGIDRKRNKRSQKKMQETIMRENWVCQFSFMLAGVWLLVEKLEG
jgi:hypothetical protein